LAQEGVEFLERLKKLKGERSSQTDKGGVSNTPQQVVPPSPQHANLAPTPVDDKKGRRKDSEKKPSSSRRSPKKARPESHVVGLSNVE